MSQSPTLFSSDDEDEDYEENLLKKFQALIQGVPPPPSVTISKLSAIDMLEKYYENKKKLNYDDLKSKNSSCKKENLTPLVYYANASKTSEEIANVSQKVLSRFVHCETMSTCNVWFGDVAKTTSAKKYLKCGLGFSPGRRLSHLARRRQIFSSENLQKLANCEKKCQIEIERQNMSKSKHFAKSNTVDVNKINSYRRALFLSPEEGEETKQRNLLISGHQHLVSSSNNHSFRSNEKNILLSHRDPFSSSSKKRRRLESKEKGGNWPRRALTFSEKETGQYQDSNSANDKVISEIQVNLHHKTKILWAVSAALKEKNIHSSNPLFKTSASALFMICRKNLNKILNLKTDGGTSDKILRFARDHVDDILAKARTTKENEKNEQNQSCSGTKNYSLDCKSKDSPEKIQTVSHKRTETFKNNSSNEEVVTDNQDVGVAKPNFFVNKMSLLTFSAVVDVDSTPNQEKENVNLIEKNNSNLVSLAEVPIIK